MCIGFFRCRRYSCVLLKWRFRGSAAAESAQNAKMGAADAKNRLSVRSVWIGGQAVTVPVVPLKGLIRDEPAAPRLTAPI